MSKPYKQMSKIIRSVKSVITSLLMHSNLSFPCHLLKLNTLLIKAKLNAMEILENYSKYKEEN